MPVHIRDFSVETNGQNKPDSPAPLATPEVPARPPSKREIAQMMKAAFRRAQRLHAD